MERLDYEFEQLEQLELAKKARELEALCRATTGVEAVTGKACQGKEKVGAGDIEMTENQRLSPDTTVAVLRKPDPNSEQRDGERDVEAATELVCQEKKKTEAGDTEVTGNQRVSSNATDAVPRKTDAVPHKIDPELREKEEKALRASSGDFPDDEGDAKTETTPGRSSQLMESSAEMPEKAVQQSRQDPDRPDRHPSGFGTKPTAPSQESTRPTRREVIEISFDEINQSCLVRLWSPDSRPFTESRGQENDDECASGSESSSRWEDGRPEVGHPKGPATGGGCAGKGPSKVTMEPGRDKADLTQVHLKTSSCPRQGGPETKNSDVVTSQRPRKRQRRISVAQSGSDAPRKKRPGKRDERHFQKKKRSSWLGGGKLQDPHPNEPRTHSSSARKEPGGGKNEPGTTQRGSKRRQSSSPVVQPGITSDGETKGDLRDYSFAPARKSNEKNLNSSSEAKSKLGVVWTPAWTSVASPAVRPRLSRDQCGLLPLKTHFLAADELLRKAPGDDLAPPNRPAQVNALEHRRQVAMDHRVDPRQCLLADFAVGPISLLLLSDLDARRPDSLGTSSTKEGLYSFPQLRSPMGLSPNTRKPWTPAIMDVFRLPSSSMAPLSAEIDRRHRGQGRLAHGAEDVSVEEFTEALGEIRAREQEAREREREVRESKKRAEEEERKRRADEEAHERARKNLEWALECKRRELEKHEYKREMERLDYEFEQLEQLELAKKARELEALCRATTGVEAVTGKACQGKEKVGAGDIEMTENQSLSPDTTVAVLRKPDPNSEQRDGERDVEAATELVCQEKKKTEAGDTEVTGNQRVSSNATDAVPRKTDAVPHKIDPELREKEEKALRASSGDFPDDEGDAKTETTPGRSSQLMESSAEMPEKAVQQSRQDPDRPDRHPSGFGTKPTAPSQESTRPTRREVIEISFDEINQSCLVRLWSPDSRPFTESRGQENDDECASGSESSSRWEDGRPEVGHPKGPATGGGCAGKGPSKVTMEPGRDKADLTQVHLKTSSCPRQGGPETKNSDVVTSQRPRKRQRRISVAQSGSDAPRKKRPGKRDERHFQKKKRSSWLGGGKLQDPLSQRATDPQLKCEKGAWRRQKRAWNDAAGFQTEAELIARVWTPAWTSVASPAVRPRLSRDQCGLLPLKTHFLAADELLRKAPGDDLAPPNRPAQVNALKHRRQVAMVSCARRQSERRIGAANAPWYSGTT
ncbi:hypothetical protein HPB47_010441 [Ixodes persulcatus]|uniref:Uncharacterized protein n=1 Tax=Ixodes persulcatus TaxID=34615 RepID=A0AC60NZE2_IXOPE|nr:hypothetical protein HPB47_010441 [Ixodes persulcatus]